MVHTRDEGEVPPVWRNQTRQTVEGLLERDMIPTSHKERVVELLEAGRPTEALDRKSTRLNSSHIQKSRMPSSA